MFQAPGRSLVNRHHHDLLTALQQCQRLAIHVANALKNKAAYVISISRMLRYIETI